MSDLDDIEAAIKSVRGRAVRVVRARRSDTELYALMADCLEICERTEAGGLTGKLVEQYLSTQDAQARNRRYFESSADAPLIVCRMVFEDEKRRDAAWRYTACLREAQRLQIPSTDLATWLARNGGLNTLFRGRSVKARTALTKTLHLNQQIEIPKSGQISLLIARDHRGFFDVLACEKIQEAAE